MKEQVKQIWIDALTGGEYRQTTGRLKNKGAMCCLGVLCDLYAKETGKWEWHKDEVGDWFFISNNSGEELLLPPPVVKWSGIKNVNGAYRGKDGMSTLTDANDSGVKFKKIAELIEENF